MNKTRLLIGLVFVLSSCLAQKPTEISSVHGVGVVDGNPLSEASDFEAQLLLPMVGVQSGSRFCTGTLIALDLVLTAAHCVSHPDVNPNDVSILRLVRDGAKTSWLTRKVRAYEAHPDYRDHLWRGHDVAVLKLDQPYPADTPVAELPPMPWAADSYFHYGPYYVAGFGITHNLAGDFSASATDPHYFRVQSMDLSDERMMEEDQSYFLNLKVTDRGAFCFGDSGGPLMAYVDGHATVFGVISNSAVHYESEAMEKEFNAAADDPKTILELRKKYPQHRLCGWGNNRFTDVGFHRDWISKAIAEVNQAKPLPKSSSWNTYSLATNEGGPLITWMRATWTVPNPPPVNSNQLVSVGVGLGASGGAALRSVLRWGVGNADNLKSWGLTCFGVSTDPTNGKKQYTTVPLISVEPGTEITAHIQLVMQQNGVYTYSCQYEQYPSSLVYFQVTAPLTAAWVQYSASNFQDCSNYVEGLIDFNKIELRAGDKFLNLNWSKGLKNVVDPMRCGMQVNVIKNPGRDGRIAVGVKRK